MPNDTLTHAPTPHAIILISAAAEWLPVRARFAKTETFVTPYGEAFAAEIAAPAGGAREGRSWPVVFVHGGWGKIDAAASTQYAIDRWRPSLLVNLGTCGGFDGDIAVGEVLLVDFTVVYDIIEQMGDADEALAAYATEIDLSWLHGPLPLPVRRELLISADRDIVAADVGELRGRFGAIAADWESGAIARVAARNGTRCLILRAVTDLVSHEEGEAYGRPELFSSRTAPIMERFIDSLPGWLAAAEYE